MKTIYIIQDSKVKAIKEGVLYVSPQYRNIAFSGAWFSNKGEAVRELKYRNNN